MQFAYPAAQGLAFVPSLALGESMYLAQGCMRLTRASRAVTDVCSALGAGVLLAAPIITGIITLSQKRDWPNLADRTVILYGCISGAIWNAGNMCAIIATRDPGVGLSVAYPILQCGLVIAGLWGILLLGELRDPKAQAGFWISAALVLTGTIMLAASK